MTALASPLTAQTDLDENAETDEVLIMDTFVVESIRGSQTAAIDIKKQSLQMVDAIVAENIGKFPDNNVVEALQRVAGIQVTGRNRGEVSTVHIRGLDDVTTTLNGRNIFTTSGRSVSLQDIPASLLNRVDIYKTRSASLIGSGIAGVIDVKTNRPFFFDEERNMVALRGTYTELSDSFDPNVSAMFSDVWKTEYGKFGALINVSYAETNWKDISATAGAMVPFITEEGASEFGFIPLERIFESSALVEESPLWQPGLEAGLPFAEGSTLTWTPVGSDTPVEVPYYLSRDAVFTSNMDGHRERSAVNAVLQYAPNDRSVYTFEAFYTGYREDWCNNLMFTFADWWDGWDAVGVDVNDAVELYPGTNIVASRVTPYAYGFMSADKTVQKTDSYVYALNGEWLIGDNLKLTGDISYQDSEFENTFIAARTDRSCYVLDVDFNDGSGVPGFSFRDNPDTTADESDLTDPSLWTIAQFYDNAGYSKGSAMTGTLDGVYETPDWKLIENFKFGIRYDDRDAEEGAYPAQAEAYLGQPLANYPELQTIVTGFYDGRADMPDAAVFISGDYLNEHADEMRDLWGITKPEMKRNFTITEKSFAAYLQSDMRYDLGGASSLSGQIGARYARNDRDLDFITDNDSKTDDTILPSAMLLYDINEQFRIRASYGETIRYPSFTSLNPTITYSDDVTGIGYGTASGGNPDLKPTESKNYDLSFEYYAAQTTMFYATAFKREVEGLVVDFRKRVYSTSPTYGENYPYILSAPDNASDGELTGWEFGAVWFPENVPDWLHGFGIQASYTILDSEQEIPVTNDAGEVIGTTKTPFFNVSDSSYSVVLAYEKSRFSARLSYVWREDFLASYEAAQFANPLGVYNDEQVSLDLQISYNLTDNLMLTFDATNLTDEEYHSYYEYEDTNNFGNWIISRTFSAGVRYSF
ncbi:MAG: TonB-dependent receptor [Opitutales bacterium]|nr:TonB-dependent receptor [Opitutales bacterium]